MASLLFLRWIRSSVLWGIGLGLAAGACIPETPIASPKPPLRCEGGVVACEQRLAEALRSGAQIRPLVDAYMAERSFDNEQDPWNRIWKRLAQRDPGQRSITLDARDPAQAMENSPEIVRTGSLPEPVGIPGFELVLAMADAGGYDAVVWIGAGPEQAASYVAFPRDPLAPHMMGILPIVRDDTLPSAYAVVLAAETHLRAAFSAAGAFEYVEAARRVEQILGQATSLSPASETALRLRFARGLFQGAGLAWEKPWEPFGDDAPAAPTPEIAPPADADSPYGDLLRVRLAKDSSAELARRRNTVFAHVAPELRAGVDLVFGAGDPCGSSAALPAFERPMDLAWAAFLPGALAEEGGTGEGARAKTTVLSLQDWTPRYEALVGLVEQTHTTWQHAATLVRRRGDSGGFRADGTLAHRRVTDLVLRHVRALLALHAADPARYAATAEMGLMYSPGVQRDDALRAALIDLTQATTQSRLGRARTAKSLLGALLVAVVGGLTYPPAFQEAHLTAVQGAFAAKIKGDLLQQTGWGTAGLYALDALVRVLTDQGPDLAFSSRQVVRALADASVEVPAVARVASALAQYAALMAKQPFSPLQDQNQWSADRRAAWESLKQAISGVGLGGNNAGPSDAPREVSEDLATLTDGLLAALSVRLHRPAPTRGAVCASDKAPSDPVLTNAFTALRKVRGRIMLSPRMKGDSLWTRRARLLFTVLSDALDIAAETKQPKKMTLSLPQVEEALFGALAEWDEAGGKEAVVGVYAIARAILSQDPSAFFKQGGPQLFRAVGGAAKFLSGGATAESGQAGGLLATLATVRARDLGSAEFSESLTGFARSLFEANKRDQADLFLLGALLIAAVEHAAPPPSAMKVASDAQSRMEWALQLFAQLGAANAGNKPDPAAFSEKLRGALDDKCVVVQTDDVADGMGAVRAFADGQRKEARRKLDALLDRAEKEGLSVPKIVYQYEERQNRRTFTLTFGLSAGAGFLEGASNFQVGLGFVSLADTLVRLKVSPASGAETAAETARYYVHAAALAAAYHFLDGDTALGAAAARRAVSAIINGVRLGKRTLAPDRAAWAKDARVVLALDAQLAAEAGLPFLAGDLWTIARATLPPDMDDAARDAFLTPLPMGLAVLPDLTKPLARVKKSIGALAEPLACTKDKIDKNAYRTGTCDTYGLALSLRVADVVDDLPRLTKPAGPTPEACVPLVALDAFLGQAQKGIYDPDLFTAAVEALRTSGRPDEAATLLARQRRPTHCNPILLAASRALGDMAILGDSGRADMLSVAVNCAGVDNGAGLEKDLASLDAATAKLVDPSRSARLLLFAAEASLQRKQPGLLLARVRAADYFERWLRTSPDAAARALWLHDIAHLLAGETFDAAKTEGTRALVCTTFAAPERKVICDEIASLRNAQTALDARKKAAGDALSRWLAQQDPAKVF